MSIVYLKKNAKISFYCFLQDKKDIYLNSLTALLPQISPLTSWQDIKRGHIAIKKTVIPLGNSFAMKFCAGIHGFAWKQHRR